MIKERDPGDIDDEPWGLAFVPTGTDVQVSGIGSRRERVRREHACMYPLGGTRMPAHGGWGTSCQGAWVPACEHACLRPGVRCGPEHRELLGMVTHHIPDSLFPSQNLPRAQAPIKHTFSIGSCRPSVGTHHALTRSSQFLAPQHTDSCTTTHTICTTTHPRQSGRISAFSGHRRRSEVVKPDFDLHHSTQTPLGGGGTSMICPPVEYPLR